MTDGSPWASALALWRAFRHRLAPHYSVELRAAVGDASTLLDVGCGVASPIRKFAERLPHTVGVEGYEPALDASRAAGIHDEYRLVDARRLADTFERRSFDVVLAVDVLEHLSRDEGFDLLAAMEGIARRRTVVFTPNGHVHQDEIGGNPLQAHRSGWSVEDLAAAGYEAIGVHGLKLLRREEARFRWRPKRVWRLVSDLTQPVVRRWPRAAYHLLAVKDVSVPPAP